MRFGFIRALPQAPEELLREVVCHEAAHLAVFLLHGDAVRPHGAEWRALMIAAGYEPRARMDVAGLSSEMQRAVRPAVLYQHRCPVCGASRVAGRAVRRWRCRGCRESGLPGTLEIVKRRYDDLALDRP